MKDPRVLDPKIEERLKLIESNRDCDIVHRELIEIIRHNNFELERECQQLRGANENHWKGLNENRAAISGLAQLLRESDLQKENIKWEITKIKDLLYEAYEIIRSPIRPSLTQASNWICRYRTVK